MADPAGNDRPEAAEFATTQWSEILLAGNPDQTGAHAALGRLCEKYWFPVYANLRRRGSNHNDAEDLVQAFFADVLSSQKLSVADQSRGRFRSFLLTACNNFVSNTHRHNNALRRGGGQKTVSLNVNMDDHARRYDETNSQQWTPDQLFDRRWALELIELATQRVWAEYESRGSSDWFDALQPFIAPAGDTPSYAQVAEGMNVSVGSVKTAVHRIRKRFGVALQEEVAETVQHQSDVKNELNILLDALAGR